MTGIIVKKKIREIIKKLDGGDTVSNVSEDVGPALDNLVEEILKKAISRAKKNQRRTLFARDL